MPTKLSDGEKVKAAIVKMTVSLWSDVATLATKKGYSSTSAFVRALLERAVALSKAPKQTRVVDTGGMRSAEEIKAEILRRTEEELAPKKKRIFEDGWDDDEPEEKPKHKWHPLFGKQCKRCGRYHDEAGICGCDPEMVI